MIRLSTRQKVRVVLYAFVCVAFGPLNRCLAQRDNEDTKILPLSTAYVPVRGEVIGKPFSITVEWDGQEYHALEGTTVLMKIIGDPTTDPPIRAKALDRLRRIPSRDTSAQLLALYDDLREPEEKVGVMRCLISSEDPRGLPLFARVLDHEQDNTVRAVAAYALAHWNVRRGVAELVNLLDSTTILRRPSIRGIALDTFVNENHRKGWGLPVDRIGREIASKADLGNEQKRALYIVEIKEWFREHEDRFPDWKPGDALPAAPKLPPIPPGPESVLSLSAAFRPPPLVMAASQEKEEQIFWDGKPYPAREGVDLLMKVALEPGISNDRFSVDRFHAIERLGRLGSRLRGTERIPQLMKLYGRLTSRSEKDALLFCLARSKDPRALPLFAGILETPHEAYLRVPAAYGLALWNVRSGVRELIELLSVKQTERPIRTPGIIADKAAHLLSKLNYWKSWWAPGAPLQAAASARAEVHDEAMDSCCVELKKWFAENEHRFPEWKPGDPLPEVAAPEKRTPAEKRAEDK